MKKHFIILCMIAIALLSCNHKTQSVSSPDGKIVITAGVNRAGNAFYSVQNDEQDIILPSQLGFVTDLFNGSEYILQDFSQNQYDETWEQPWGERRLIRNHYNELTMHLMSVDSLMNVNVVFRAFDDGFGFRYEFSNRKSAATSFRILDELTEFNFPWDAEAWSGPTNHTEYLESLWTKSPLSTKDTVVTPVTIEVNDHLFLALHEANLTDYASLNVAPQKKRKTAASLKATLVPWSDGTLVYASLPSVTPWRTMLVADKAGDLITSYLELNLNEPCQIANTSWIEPSRYIGIWWGMHMKKYTWEMGPNHGATTQNACRYIDFAAAHGFKGVLVEGWNRGWDGDWTRIDDHFSYTEPYPDYDLQKICQYGASKGVRIIAHTETGGAVTNFEQQMDSAFALYHRLGINTVKTGYVNPKHDGKELQRSQLGVRHYRKVVETAAKYQIMIDNHEPAMPTGIRRTFPNLMTGEGVRGQEWNAWSADGGNPPYHTCVLPFTRGLAGPMDFTPVIFNFNNTAMPMTHPHSTIAKQLAEFMILYSPLQMAADMIENMEGQPALEFVESCPTTWEQTLVLDSKIGEYIVEARQVRNDIQPIGKEPAAGSWFVAAMTNEEARTLSIDLSFLEPDKTYTATIYADGDGADYVNNPYPLAIRQQEVTAKTILPVYLARSGGVAIIIRNQE